MGSFEATLSLAQVTQELKTVYENLTSTQERCTKLVEENRKLAAELSLLKRHVAACDLRERNRILAANERVHDCTDDHV